MHVLQDEQAGDKPRRQAGLPRTCLAHRTKAVSQKLPVDQRRHPLVRLAALMDWKFLDDRSGSVCQTGPRQPGLPTRLVAGLFILKHMHNLSDEVLCARWIENPYYQYF